MQLAVSQIYHTKFWQNLSENIFPIFYTLYYLNNLTLAILWAHQKQLDVRTDNRLICYESA